MLRRMTAALATLAVVALVAPVWAEAKVGEPAPDFELTSVSDGKTYKLSEVQGPVVLIWQSKQCPWDFMRPEAGYQRMLSPLASEYAAKGVTFLAINSNKGESADDLKSYHAQHSIPYPILKDPGNQVADAYGAKTTPHIFIRDAAGNLVYKGGIEKAPSDPAACGTQDEQYLKPVLDALLAGQELPFTETVSKGCSVKRVK